VSRSRAWVATAITTAAIMLATMVTGCTSPGSATERVVIGVDLELTGAGSYLGQVYRRALELRVDQINEAGLLGNRRLELKVMDNRTDSGVAVTNISRLAEDPEVVAIITGGCDACLMASLETVTNAGVPVVSLASTAELVEPVDERRYIFKLGPDAVDVAQVLARELVRTGVESIGLVTSDQPYGVEGQREMLIAAERFDIEVVARSISEGGEGADGVAAEVLVGQDPDAVVIWASGPATGAVAQSLRARGFTGQILLAPSSADELFVASAVRSALNGARMVFTESLVIDGLIASSPAKAARQTWLREYTAHQGTYHAHASFAADAVQVLAAAMSASETVDRESIRAALENTQIDGFTGPIRFRLETHSGLSPQALVMLVAQGDRWRLAAS
jgi:ABC-type branched-chain amino acid transport systems, periplasmic component